MKFYGSKMTLMAVLFALFMVGAVSAATGTWIESIDVTDTAQPGEVVQIDMLVGYEFDEETEITPSVWDYTGDDWADDTYENVTGTGEKTYTLFLRVPETVGDHLYTGLVLYWDGIEWILTAEASALNFTITVEGTPVQPHIAQIVSVDYPSTVLVRADLEISVDVHYILPDDTAIAVGLTEIIGDDEEIIDEILDTVSGEGTETYFFEVTAPEEAGTTELSADILFLVDDEWDATPDIWYKLFTIEVEEPEAPPPDDPVQPSGGIPGFPLTAVAVSLGLLYFKKKRKKVNH